MACLRPFTKPIILLLIIIATTTNGDAAAAGAANNATAATTHAPARNGVAPARNGLAPARKRVSPARNGVAPARNRVAPARNGVATIPLTPQEKEFLDAHNMVRIHSGLPLLTWDRKAAAYAGWYARSRSKDCALVHSTGPFGENIFWGEGLSWTPRMAVKDWVKEHRFYNRMYNSCKMGQMCGHYTQIVWRDTQRIGCAQVACGGANTYVVCSYDPPGNYRGMRPFDKHNPSMYNKSDRLNKISWIPS